MVSKRSLEKIAIVVLHAVLRKSLSEIEDLMNYGSDVISDYLLKNADCRTTAERLKDYLENAEAESRREPKRKVHLVTYWDEEYPEELRTIDNPPVFLFAKGNLDLLWTDKFAVVGTRRMTPYGRNVTEAFVRELCKYFTIVSGLAYGVDAIAHATCLAQQRPTIAVLGNGVDVVYPKTNARLYERIAECGCLVSEYLPWEEPKKYTFVARNRIISGLSKGVLVTEAGIDSGALITARFALDQGRDVFAVPGDVNREQSRGTNQLIKDGAFVATEPTDVLSCYGFREHRKVVELSEDEKEVVENLPKHGTLERLAEELGKSIPELMVTITVLELKGLVYRDADGSYKVTRL